LPQKALYRSPVLTVDVIINYGGKIVLVERGKGPFEGQYALPGGHVELYEKLKDAARREVKEETGLDLENLSYFGYYDDPERDPRNHYVSIVFTADGKWDLVAGDDASSVKLFSVKELPQLAFDHKKILEDYVRCAR
jgi:8-oxo-dGTP diphosphatase